MTERTPDLSRFVEFSRKIIGVGKNYGSLVAERDGKVPQNPIVFLKPSTAYVTEGNPIKIPRGCSELVYEAELGLVIGRKASNVTEAEAMDYICGYCITLDMTAADVLTRNKKEGTPWNIAKGFDTACPVGPLIAKQSVGDPQSLDLWCKVNGQSRQKGNTSDMIMKIPRIVSYVSQFFTLEAGDLILTGTPAGVGPVRAGDILEAGLSQLTSIRFKVEDN